MARRDLDLILQKLLPTSELNFNPVQKKRAGSKTPSFDLSVYRQSSVPCRLSETAKAFVTRGVARISSLCGATRTCTGKPLGELVIQTVSVSELICTGRAATTGITVTAPVLRQELSCVYGFLPNSSTAFADGGKCYSVVAC